MALEARRDAPVRNILTTRNNALIISEFGTRSKKDVRRARARAGDGRTRQDGYSTKWC